MSSSKLPKGLADIASEYFVTDALSRPGYIASITLRNTRGIDILISNATATQQIAVQVKTNQSSKPEWVLNKKAETFYADNLFHVFVNLKGPEEQLDFYTGLPPGLEPGSAFRQAYQRWPHHANQPNFA